MNTYIALLRGINVGGHNTIKMAGLKIPETKALRCISDYKKDSESFAFIDEVLYLHLPEGYGRTKLHNTFFEQQLHCKATTRNHNTLGKLIAIYTKDYIDKKILE